MAARTPDPEPADSRTVDWGEYSAAVHRWELITGRPAPYPTQAGRHGRPVLAPAFVEWLMGLPPGWTSAETLELPRTAQLRALGNGVMPQQAAHALTLLLEDLAHLSTDEVAPAQPRRARAAAGSHVRHTRANAGPSKLSTTDTTRPRTVSARSDRKANRSRSLGDGSV